MKLIDKVRKDLDQHKAQKMQLITQVEQYAPNVSKEHIEDVFDALWLLQKLEIK